MLDRVVEALQTHQGVHDWLMRRKEQRSHQLYLIGSQTENRRTVSTEQVAGQVHNDHPARSDDGPRRGAATIVLLPTDVGTIHARLDEAVFMAGLGDNEPYGLPQPAPFPGVDIVDERIASQPQQALDELRDALLSAVEREPDIFLSSAEFFLNETHTDLRNSRGVCGEKRETDVFLDIVIMAATDGDEAEDHVAVQCRRVQDTDIAATVQRHARQARDSLRAAMPATRTGPVAVSREALKELLAAFVPQTAGALKYQEITTFRQGESFFGQREVRGDALTLFSNALLPYGLKSVPFDDEGLPGRKVALVEDNVLREFWTPQRYADYLGCPPTGAFANVDIPPGTTPAAELLAGDEPLCHIVAFSWMDPDPITGNFVGEIRLGYEIEGQTTTPIKGGSLSGNIFDAFADARFSQETIFLGDYRGPETVRFGQLVVSGA